MPHDFQALFVRVLYRNLDASLPHLTRLIVLLLMFVLTVCLPDWHIYLIDVLAVFRLMLMFNVCVIYRACVYLCLRQSTACAPVWSVYVVLVSRHFVSSTLATNRACCVSARDTDCPVTFSVCRKPHPLWALLHGRQNRRDTAFVHTHAYTHTMRYLYCFRMKRIWRLYLCLASCHWYSHIRLQSPHLHTSVRRSLTFFVANEDVCF